MSAVVRARSPDTDPEVEEIQFALLRQRSVGERLRLAFSLSETVIRLARGAIRRTLDDPGETEVGLKFVELHYGRELADALRAYLAARRSSDHVICSATRRSA
jgi:hypothetical protein